MDLCNVCMYVCVYICTYVRMHVCTYICRYVNMYISTYVCAYACSRLLSTVHKNVAVLALTFQGTIAFFTTYHQQRVTVTVTVQ